MSHDAGHVHGPTCGGSAEAGWLDRIRWDENGLVPAIAQDAASHRVLMMAWMNREALAETLHTGHAVYWSRSRQRLWRKGEASGNQQRVHEIRTDCDADVILLFIDQVGGVACHTGRESCFFRRLEGCRLGQGAVASEAGALSSLIGGAGETMAPTQPAAEPVWRDVDPVKVDPEKLYGASAAGHSHS